MLMKILIRIRKYSILVIIQLILKFCDDSNRVVVAKMKDEIAGVAIKKLVVLKAKMYSFLVDYNSERKKQSLIFSLIRTAFLNFFVLVYIKWLIVIIVQITINLLKISIGAITKNPEIHKFT